MDSIDKKILQALQSDSSGSIADIADRAGVSQTPCWRRIKKLEEAGLVNVTQKSGSYSCDIRAQGVASEQKITFSQRGEGTKGPYPSIFYLPWSIFIRIELIPIQPPFGVTFQASHQTIFLSVLLLLYIPAWHAM